MQNYEQLGAFYLGRVVDRNSGDTKPEYLLYDARDLTTHAVCVGMTGSGKTGLCVSLLEEAAIDGIPAIIIDPKGDLGNMMLAFPDLAPGDFEPWIDPQEAARKGLSLQEHAKRVAETWKKGLESWDQEPDRISQMKESAEMAIYTPGSTTGRPLMVLRSLDAPKPELRSDSSAMRERIMSAVSGLLGLIGIDADPIGSREHILLSSILDSNWQKGLNLELPDLIQSIQKPPFDRVGVFDIETFFPARDRLVLAMRMNNLLASPGFAAWMTGDPLDIQRLLYSPSGKPRLSILSIAHLSDPERMFFVTLLLNETLSWMRSQPGTSSLRAILYMDEIFGYFPSTSNPPSKAPMLTLLKQARAFGLGIVLATQNPVDLDYKGLSNTGTWFIGRLQTERDKARIMEGLESVGGSQVFSGVDMDALLSNLGNRVFLMRNVHDQEPVLFQTRWALTYLRGPMTLRQIDTLISTDTSAAAPVKTGLPVTKQSGTDSLNGDMRDIQSAPVTARLAKPVVSPDLPEMFLKPSGWMNPQKLVYRPRIVAVCRLHFVQSGARVDVWQTRLLLASIANDGSDGLWREADVTVDGRELAEDRAPMDGVPFAELPAAASNPKVIRSWGKSLETYLYQDVTLNLLTCPEYKLYSEAEESDGDFRARVSLMAREKRDLLIDKLKSKYESQLSRLQEKYRTTAHRLEQHKAQISQHKLSTALSVGTTILGALFGRKAASVGTVSRASTAMRSAGRIAGKKEDVAHTEATLRGIQQEMAELDAAFARDRELLSGQLEEPNIETVPVRPRKSDITLIKLALAWKPEETAN
ncbi:ATP-binding protein [bacterium]|nr:ATP-binding protein [candidate division CSSED10-310 bacterium]